jgi:hypothetical protein
MASILGRDYPSGAASGQLNGDLAWGVPYVCTTSVSSAFFGIRTNNICWLKFAIYDNAALNNRLYTHEDLCYDIGWNFRNIPIAFTQGNTYWICCKTEYANVDYIDDATHRGYCFSASNYDTFEWGDTYDWDAAYNLGWGPVMAVFDVLPDFGINRYDVFDGHSITSNLTDKWPGQTVVNIPDHVVSLRTYGRGGYQSAQVLADWPDRAGSLFLIPGVETYYYLDIGANDWHDDITAETVFANVGDICALARAHGYIVVAMTDGPRYLDSPAQEQERADYNQMLRDEANETIPFYDYLIDIAAITDLQTYYDTVYYDDGVHPSFTGQCIYSVAATAAIGEPGRAIGGSKLGTFSAAGADLAHYCRFKALNDTTITGVGMKAAGSGNAIIAVYSGTSSAVGSLLGYTSSFAIADGDNWHAIDDISISAGSYYYLHAMTDSNRVLRRSATGGKITSASATWSGYSPPSAPTGLTYTDDYELSLWATTDNANQGNDCTIEAVGDGDIYSTDTGIHIIGTNFGV